MYWFSLSSELSKAQFTKERYFIKNVDVELWWWIFSRYLDWIDFFPHLFLLNNALFCSCVVPQPVHLFQTMSSVKRRRKRALSVPGKTLRGLNGFSSLPPQLRVHSSLPVIPFPLIICPHLTLYCAPSSIFLLFQEKQFLRAGGNSLTL